MIGLTVTGADELAARLDGMPAALAARLGAVMARLGQALYARVEENLSRAVLQPGSGKLAAAIEQQADGLSASVGFESSAVPYGAAQEFGADLRAHLIEARNAKALAFVVAGKRVFAKRVMFPGAHLPERSFLRSALAGLTPDACDEIAAAVAETVT